MTRRARTLGSARGSRAGDCGLAIANFFFRRLHWVDQRSMEDCFGEPPKPARGPRALPRVIVCAALFFGSALSLPATQEEIAARAALEQRLNAQLPLDAVFRDEHGSPVQLGNYFGSKPVILALAYYECPSLCTLVLNGVLQTAQDLKFDAGKEYEIVVVSFDARERPALAAAKKQIYTQRYGRAGTANGWHFLTGDEPNIARLAESVGYRFVYDEATRQFAHPSTIMIVTPSGKVSRYFPGIEYPARDVRLALIEASENKVGSLAEKVFLLCFHYNPATGKYGLLILRLIQLACLGTVMALAFYIARMVGRDRWARRAVWQTERISTSPDGPAVRPYRGATIRTPRRSIAKEG